MSGSTATLRRALLGVGSVLFGAALIALVIKIGHIDLKSTMLQVRRANPFAFVKLILLNIAVVFLSTEKWRSIDVVLRKQTDSVPSRVESFAVTSFGMALGLILPLQLGMATARTLGTHGHGQSLKRGGVGTLFEQGVEFLIVVLLALASAATLFSHGGVRMWAVSATAMVAIGFVAVGVIIRFVKGFGSARPPMPAQGMRWLKVRELQRSKLLDVKLGHRLVLLSVLRSGCIILMADQTARAVHIPISLWHMAAAVPFVVITTALGITPGGIGVNELTMTTTLKLFGTPLALAAQWSVANRLLATASCVMVAIGAAILLAVEGSTKSDDGSLENAQEIETKRGAQG